MTTEVPVTHVRRSGPSLSEWLALVVGVALIVRYRWLIDDAFVYFRYVDNLLFMGRGLVYNQGEFVEGFSGPLWTLILIPLRALHLDYWDLVLGAGLVCYGAFWWFATRVNRALAPRASAIVNVPLLFLSANYAVSSWFTSGLEVPLVQVVAAAFAYLVVTPSSRLAQVIVGLGPLARPELMAAFAFGASWSWMREKRLPWCLVLTMLLTQIAWITFRVYYYADFFPNTFYLKNGIDPAQGLTYLGDAFLTYRVPFLMVGLLLVAAVLGRRPGSAHSVERVVMIATALPGIAYVIKIGGTHVHYMYLAFSFCVCVLALGGVVERALTGISDARSRSLVRALLTLGTLGGSFAQYPGRLSSHPVERKKMEVLAEEKISDSSFARTQHQLSYAGRAGHVPIDAMVELRERSPNGVVLHDQTVVHSWCVSLYGALTSRAINRHGLTDGVLARVEAQPLRPGHYKLRDQALAIRDVHEQADFIGRGMYRRAVENGTAPAWIEANVDALERIAEKIYNRHDLLENLRLAFRFDPKMQP